MSVTALDFNNDGCMDIFVANDAMENHYFENTGKGHFAEKALEMRHRVRRARAGRLLDGPVSAATSTATACSTSTSPT